MHTGHSVSHATPCDLHWCTDDELPDEEERCQSSIGLATIAVAKVHIATPSIRHLHSQLTHFWTCDAQQAQPTHLAGQLGPDNAIQYAEYRSETVADEVLHRQQSHRKQLAFRMTYLRPSDTSRSQHQWEGHKGSSTEHIQRVEAEGLAQRELLFFGQIRTFLHVSILHHVHVAAMIIPAELRDIGRRGLNSHVVRQKQ